MEVEKFCLDTQIEEIQELMSMDVLCGINHDQKKCVNEEDEQNCIVDFCSCQPSLMISTDDS